MQTVAHDIEGESRETSAPLTQFLIDTVYQRFAPLPATFLALLLAAPLLALVFLSPSLFVTDPVMEVLALWLDARAIVDQPPSLDIAAAALADGSFLYFMLINLATMFSVTPGEALLGAQGLVAITLLPLLAFSAASRLPVVPALALSLFVALIMLSPAGGPLAAAATMNLAVFLWLTLVCLVPPQEEGGGQVEGLAAGLGLWVLYMSALPLFLVVLCGLVVALLTQRRRGLILFLMALSTLVVLAASAEILSVMTLGHGLLGVRLADITMAPAIAGFGLAHILALMIVLSGLITRQHGPVRIICIVFFLGLGGAVLAGHAGGVLPFLVLMAIITVFGVPEWQEEYQPGTSAGQAGPALVALPLILGFAEAAVSTNLLVDQYQRAPLVATAQLGFSFADEPVTARAILARRIEPAVAAELGTLTPADQAILLDEGVRLAVSLARSEGSVSLVGARDFSFLLGEKFEAPGRAQIVLAPTLAFDPLTDAARVNSQGILYAEYRRAARPDQLSPVYDIWVRRNN